MVLNTIAYDEIVDVEQEVVGGNLLEYLLCEFYVRSLVLNDHTRTKLAVVEHAVAPETLVADREFHLVGEQSLGVGLVFDEKVGEMLSHPLFGSERHIAAAEKIEDCESSVSPSDAYLLLWQIQFLHVLYI